MDLMEALEALEAEGREELTRIQVLQQELPIEAVEAVAGNILILAAQAAPALLS